MAAAGKQLNTAVRSERVVIESVRPEIDCGRFPSKRVIGEEVVVEADVFVEGHEALSCALLYRKKGATRWTEAAMEPLVNDRWRASFTVHELGRYQYTVLAWPDSFKAWVRDLEKRIDAAQDVTVDLEIGARLVDAAAEHAHGAADRLRRYAAQMRGLDPDVARASALDARLAALMSVLTSHKGATRYDRELEVVVDPVRARFSTWYELFPRSTSRTLAHGTFADVENWLPHVAGLGFDVLYLPPIHPISRSFRKGRNNALEASEDDVGSPWAIGGAEGGHKAIHPELGTIEDFRRLLACAREQGIEIALDIAFQAAPDHPYVKEHPEWFRHRPDGTIQYAENPPKKYQDIYPFDFDSADSDGLWRELRSVFEFWLEQGVRIFRVDNPHTKPFPFWEWTLTTLKQKYPDAIFLSEAFTRPKVMYRLAKLGFTQSYTYFAWRHHKWEIEQYFNELTGTEVAEFFRPNLWPNTPDILTEPFQTHGRPMFVSRLILAATLGASYGIYGPPYELMEHTPREIGSEEYLNSEKYQVREWRFEGRETLSWLIARVNHIRRDNPALQSDRSLRFHRIDNEQIIAYSKHTPDLQNVIITIVNLDPANVQQGFVELPLETLGLPAHTSYHVQDLLSGESYEWNGASNFVQLNPQRVGAHILRVEREPDGNGAI
jgi:starch synthase (maltosyl-transferring)